MLQITVIEETSEVQVFDKSTSHYQVFNSEHYEFLKEAVGETKAKLYAELAGWE
jgi:hypothetical protein